MATNSQERLSFGITYAWAKKGTTASTQMMLAKQVIIGSRPESARYARVKLLWVSKDGVPFVELCRADKDWN